MIHWQVRAESRTGAILTFGVEAPDGPSARKAAAALIPFELSALAVDPIPTSPAAGGFQFRDHQFHDGSLAGHCRFCRG